MALLARSAARSAVAGARASRPRSLTVRAADDKVFFGGKEYTQEEWNAAKASGNLPSAAEPTPAPMAAPAPVAAAPVSFGQLMAFSGPAPELINGRLAMIGVVAALAAEFSSGESVLRQLADEPTGIMAAFALVIAASFVPLLNNSAPSSESFGPFTAAAEKLNGRAAMIGFAALLGLELARGSALF